MSTATRSLWPDDLQTQDLRTATEIIQEQAHLLEVQTNGVLTGEVVEHSVEDRRVIALDVNAPRIPTTVRLFEVHQPLGMDYPVRIIPPNLDVPESLQKRVYRPGLNIASLPGVMAGHWEERQWVAETPAEFAQKLQQLLGNTATKAILFNLLSRSRRNSDESASPPIDAA